MNDEHELLWGATEIPTAYAYCRCGKWSHHAATVSGVLVAWARHMVAEDGDVERLQEKVFMLLTEHVGTAQVDYAMDGNDAIVCGCSMRLSIGDDGGSAAMNGHLVEILFAEGLLHDPDV